MSPNMLWLVERICCILARAARQNPHLTENYSFQLLLHSQTRSNYSLRVAISALELN